MTCLAGVLPFCFACGTLLLIALAALLVGQSSSLGNRSDGVFGAVILAVSLMVFLVSSVAVYFKCREPESSAGGAESRPWLLWLERAGVLAVGVFVLALAALVIHNEASAPNPSEAQRSNINFATVILVAACLVVLVSSVNIAWRLLPLVRSRPRTSEVAVKSHARTIGEA